MKSNVVLLSDRTLHRGSIKGAVLPREVAQAMAQEWGVFVDAFLTDAAKVGDRYAAIAYFRRPGSLAEDGVTVATPAVREISSKGAFKLVQTFDGQDHYVLVSEHVTKGHI